ncbi:Kinesin-like protein [Drosera capensis]
MAPPLTPLKRTQSLKSSTPSKNSNPGLVSRVRVVVRVRPFLAGQIVSEKGGQPVVSCVSVLDSEGKAENEVVVCMRAQDSRVLRNFVKGVLDVVGGAIAISWTDNRRSCSEGIRLQESAKNNQSLLALSNNPGEYLECRHTVSIAAPSRHVTNMVASAQKHEVPNMEAKLHAWLEPRGRTKSVQRIEGIRSPPFSRTPSSLRKLDPSEF